MVENGLVYAVNKSIEKSKKRELKESEKADKLRELLIKYNVNFSDKFSIKNWTKKDIITLSKVTNYPMTYITLNDNDNIKF